MRTAVGGFYAWARRRGYVDEDPALDLPSVRVSRGLPRPAPDDILLAALRAAAPRERLMLRLAAFGGLRADRKRVVSGKGVSVSVDLGGRRILTKKQTETEWRENRTK